MNSIQDELISLDINEFIFVLRKDASHPACESLLFDKLDQLKIHLPLQILLELKQRGAKKGDAVIAAHLEAAGVRYFISENRHFIAEITDLPFKVLTSEEILRLLG